MGPEGEGYSLKESETKKLAYTDEFRAMLKEHPGIIGQAKEMMDRAVTDYDPQVALSYGPAGKWVEEQEARWNKEKMIWENHLVDEEADRKKREEDARYFSASEDPYYYQMSKGRGMFFAPGETDRDEQSGLELTVLGISRRRMKVGLSTTYRTDESDYFKASLGENSYFIKRSNITVTPGFNEFKNTIRAKEALADLDYVRVIEPQLGYQDNDQSWYVSKWEDIEAAGFAPYREVEWGGMDDYGQKVAAHNVDEHTWWKVYRPRYEEIQKRLAAIGLNGDLHQNLFLNVDTGQFILLDLTEVEGERTGEALYQRPAPS